MACRFEDGTIHSLPQDYADMIGWEELTALADSAYRMIEDKECLNYLCRKLWPGGSNYNYRQEVRIT